MKSSVYFEEVISKERLLLARRCHSDGTDVFIIDYCEVDEGGKLSLMGGGTRLKFPVYLLFQVHDAVDRLVRATIEEEAAVPNGVTSCFIAVLRFYVNSRLLKVTVWEFRGHLTPLPAGKLTTGGWWGSRALLETPPALHAGATACRRRPRRLFLLSQRGAFADGMKERRAFRASSGKGTLPYWNVFPGPGRDRRPDRHPRPFFPFAAQVHEALAQGGVYGCRFRRP